MAKLIAVEKAGILEAGNYPATCVWIADLGIQNKNFTDKDKGIKVNKDVREVLFAWELPTEMIEIEDKVTKEKKMMPRVVSKTYTLSLNTKSTLRGDLDSWLGKEIKDKEYDLFERIQKTGQVQITHSEGESKEGNKKTYCNVEAVTMVTKGLTVAEPVTDIVTFAFDPDEIETEIAKLEKLPKWIRKKIYASKTWLQVVGTEPPEIVEDDDEPEAASTTPVNQVNDNDRATETEKLLDTLGNCKDAAILPNLLAQFGMKTLADCNVALIKRIREKVEAAIKAETEAKTTTKEEAVV